jgi:hypothetical protein
LPREVLSLVNNWILLKITDPQVITKLKDQVPMVDNVTWTSLKNFAPGRSAHGTPASSAIEAYACA